MSRDEVLKVCLIHGDLTIEMVNKNGGGGYRCKECVKETRKKNYERNKATILARQKKNTEENPERRREIKYASWLKNRDKNLEKVRDYRKRYVEKNKDKLASQDNDKKARYRKELHPVYVRSVIASGSSLSASDIPDSLTRTFKEMMVLKKRIKEKNKHERVLSINIKRGEEDEQG
jgi:hypothetical protein